MANPLAVLIVEDSESDAQLIIRLLNKAGYEVTCQQVETAEEMHAALEKQTWDVVISDYSLPYFDGPRALALLHESGLDIPFIVVSGTIGEEIAVVMMKSGAHDFLVKGNLARLVPAVEREIAQAKERRERRRAEEELRRSRELLHQSFASLYDAIFIVDAATTEILDCNPAACEMFGYERSEMLGQTTEFLHVDRAALIKFRERLDQAVQDMGFLYLPEFQMRRKDGTIFSSDHTVTPLKDGAGQITGWVSVIRDITERKRAEEALRRNESILRGFLEQSEDAIMLANEQGVIIQWSKGAEKMTGYSRAESIGMPLWDVQFRSAPDEFKSTEHYELIKASVQAALLTGEGTILNHLTEAALQRPDGTRSITQALAFPVRTDNGFMLGSVLRDITERKHSEEALWQTAALLSEALDIARLANWEYDVEKDLFLFNDHFYAIFHTTAEREGGYRMSSAQYAQRLVYPDDAAVVGAAIEKALASTERNYRTQLEHRILYADGGIGYISVSIHIDKDEQGRIIRYYGVNQDITELRRAAEMSTYLASIVEASDDAIIGKTLDGIITSWNSGARQLYGYSAEEVIGQPISLLIPPDRPDELPEILSRIRRGESVEHYETIRLRKDSARLDVSLTVSPIKDASGQVVGASSIGRDITSRKQAEQALQASEARYRGLFEDSPISLWEEDFSAVKQRLDRLSEEGIKDFNAYFISHPEVVLELSASIKVVDINKATMKMFGAHRKEELAKNLADLFVIGQNREFLTEFVNLAEGKTSFGWDGINQTLDGRLINIGLWWSAAPGYEKSLARVIISMIDITERKQAEAALAKSERDYRALFENMPIGLYRTTTDGRILDANQAMVKIFGYPDREALLAANVKDLYLDPTSDRKFKAEIEKGDILPNFESEFKRPDGSIFWAEDHIRLIRNEAGDPLFYEGSIIDITERRRAEKRIREQLEHLAALRTIDQMITASFDLHNSLTLILKQVTKELEVDAADVLLLNSTNLFLDYSAGVGFRTKAAEKASVRMGQSYAGRVALERQMIQVPDLMDQPDDLPLKTQLAGEDFAAYIGVPLVAKGSVKGVMEVYHRTRLQPDQEWLDFLNTLAGQAALAIDNAQLFENLQRSNIDLTLAYDATIEGWSHAMDLRDKETEGHTLRVTEITMELAGLFGIRDEDLVSIRRGALLHDIGKMGVPDAILLKPDTLTDEEWVIMRKHPMLAFELLSAIRYLRSAIDIPYCHHEKWDGTGYPRGLKGEQIPLSARIFTIVDVWDALTSDRPYRKAWSKEKTIEYIESQSGKHFDPQILAVCLESGVFEGKKPEQNPGHNQVQKITE